MAADDDGGDRILHLTGAALVIAIVAALAVVVLAGANTPPGGEAAPDANWSVERANASYVTLEHAGGEDVRPSELVVTVNGKQRHPAWPPVVTEGDSVRLRVQPGQTVRVFWDPGEGDRTLLYNEPAE